jgi:hypothetical protein
MKKINKKLKSKFDFSGVTVLNLENSIPTIKDVVTVYPTSKNIPEVSSFYKVREMRGIARTNFSNIDKYAVLAKMKLLSEMKVLLFHQKTLLK